MKITEFIQDAFFSLPKYQTEKEDYKRFVFKMLDEFLNKLNLVDRFEDIEFSIITIKERQNHLVKFIKKALDDYYDGKPSDALIKLNRGLNSNIKNFGDLLNVRVFSPESDFYRIRIHKENFSLPSDQFFHIPFHMRGKVKTQRFSIPGFPSLYLGTTVYVCWEELNRPNLNDFQAVRLRSTSEIKVIDLSPPKSENVKPYEYYKFLMTWPLVFSSSVSVRNYEDYFKPEYIIPQLLLQWVRENQEIDGIAYQTTHIVFSKTLSKGEFLNVVLPVKENKIRGLCNSLKHKFVMTEATSIQLNQSATSGAPFFSGNMNNINDKIQKIELVKGRAFNYDISALGGLEGILLDMETNEI